MLLLIITNDPTKYYDETAITESIEKEAVELQNSNDNQEKFVSKCSFEDSEMLVKKSTFGESEIFKINQSLIDEIKGYDNEINQIQNSLQFFAYIIIMSYMLGMPLFFNISKKSIGINA